MRRMVIPILIGILTVLMANVAFGQFNNDYIGFRDQANAEAGDSVWIPVFMASDSTISGASMAFGFDHSMLHPVILDDQDYRDSLELDPSLDSLDWTWSIETRLTDTARNIVLQDLFVQTVYNLNNPDKAAFLWLPDFDLVYFDAGSIDHTGLHLADIHFTVDDAALTDAQSALTVLDSIVGTNATRTEMAQEWHTIPDDPTQSFTVSIEPLFWNNTFTVGGEPPPVDSNVWPVMTAPSAALTTYTVNQGELVSFSVSATDAEDGTVTLYVNRGSTLPANARFSSSTNGIVVGGGGSVSDVFSFTPDINQEGTFTFTFQAEDDSGQVSALQPVVQVTVNKLITDVLYTASAAGQSPEGGVPGLDQVLVPINIVTEKVIYGLQFDMQYDADNFTLDSIIATDRIPDWVVYDNNGTQAGQIRVIAFGLSNDPMVSGTSSEIMYLAFTVDENAEPDCYPLELSNAFESIDPSPDIPAFELTVSSGILCVDKWGDVNFNGVVEVDDAVGMVSHIIGTYEFNRRQFAAGDIITNDTVNVVDLIGVIYTSLDLPIPDQASPAPIAGDDEFAYLNVIHDEIPYAGYSTEMAVEAELPTTVAGVQLNITYDKNSLEMLRPQLAPEIKDNNDFTLWYKDDGLGNMRVMIHSWKPWNENQLIGSGISDIVILPMVSRAPIAADDNSRVKINQAFVSDGAAKNVPVANINPNPLPTSFELYQNRPNPFNPTTTIDFYIDGSENGSDQVKLEVFNVLGQLVKTLIDEPLLPGQHKVVWDGTDSDGAHTASGVYLYRLRIGEASQTKKMVLLK